MLKAGNEKNADGEFPSPSLLSVCCDGARLRSLKPRLTPASLTVCGRMIPSVSSSQHVSHWRKFHRHWIVQEKITVNLKTVSHFYCDFCVWGKLKWQLSFFFFISWAELELLHNVNCSHGASFKSVDIFTVQVSHNLIVHATQLTHWELLTVKFGYTYKYSELFPLPF